MQIDKIIELIENFAPLETQEPWDCSGFIIKTQKTDIKKILLCVSVTQQIVNQAFDNNCDLIIAHHPLFSVPLSFNKGMQIYCAHTNLDKADGGTTDTIMALFGYKGQKVREFLRIVDLDEEILLRDFIHLIKSKLNLTAIKVVNNSKPNSDLIAVKKLAFCAGSGADFLEEARQNQADILITGDVKYHIALDSDIIMLDIGHFESERPVLNTIKNLLEPLNIEVMIADEKSPFINY